MGRRATLDSASPESEPKVIVSAGDIRGQTTDFIAGDLTGQDGSGATGGPLNLFDGQINVPAVAIPFTQGFCFQIETLDGANDFCPGIFGIPDTFSEFVSFATASGKVGAKRRSAYQLPVERRFLIPVPLQSMMSLDSMTCSTAAFHPNPQVVPIRRLPGLVRLATTTRVSETTVS